MTAHYGSFKRHGMASGSICTRAHQQLTVKYFLTHDKARNALHRIMNHSHYALTWCFCNSLMLLKDLLHTSQWYQHFLLGMCWCLLRQLLLVNNLLHTSQEYGHSPVRVRRCFLQVSCTTVSHSARSWLWPCFRTAYSDRFLPLSPFPAAIIRGIGHSYEKWKLGAWPESWLWVFISGKASPSFVFASFLWDPQEDHPGAGSC